MSTVVQDYGSIKLRRLVLKGGTNTGQKLPSYAPRRVYDNFYTWRDWKPQACYPLHSEVDRVRRLPLDSFKNGFAARTLAAAEISARPLGIASFGLFAAPYPKYVKLRYFD